MNEKAIAGIFLVVISLLGLVLFFPIYSPTNYGGWGCPMLGRHGYGWRINPGSNRFITAFYGYPLIIVIFDLIFIAILLLGVYLIWRSTQ